MTAGEHGVGHTRTREDYRRIYKVTESAPEWFADWIAKDGAWEANRKYADLVWAELSPDERREDRIQDLEPPYAVSLVLQYELPIRLGQVLDLYRRIDNLP